MANGKNHEKREEEQEEGGKEENKNETRTKKKKTGAWASSSSFRGRGTLEMPPDEAVSAISSPTRRPISQRDSRWEERRQAHHLRCNRKGKGATSPPVYLFSKRKGFALLALTTSKSNHSASFDVRTGRKGLHRPTTAIADLRRLNRNDALEEARRLGRPSSGSSFFRRRSRRNFLHWPEA